MRYQKRDNRSGKLYMIIRLQHYRFTGPRLANLSLRFELRARPHVVFTNDFQDGTKVVSGGADKAARMFDLQSGQATQVAAHDEPVSCVRMFQAPNAGEMLVTGSWDKTLKYWDLRQQQPAATVQIQDRVYTLDVSQGLLVTGTAERYINVINLANPTTIFKTIQSPLKWQTRVVSCFPDASGFAVGSIEGRCAIQYVDDKNAR